MTNNGKKEITIQLQLKESQQRENWCSNMKTDQTLHFYFNNNGGDGDSIQRGSIFTFCPQGYFCTSEYQGIWAQKLEIKNC